MDLLQQIKEKSDEIARLQKTVGKLEASHAKHIASLKTLAVANLRASSELGRSSSPTHPTLVPNFTSSSASDGRRSVSPFRSGSRLVHIFVIFYIELKRMLFIFVIGY